MSNIFPSEVSGSSQCPRIPDASYPKMNGRVSKSFVFNVLLD